jgi:hypothetical protein
LKGEAFFCFANQESSITYKGNVIYRFVEEWRARREEVVEARGATEEGGLGVRSIFLRKRTNVGEEGHALCVLIEFGPVWVARRRPVNTLPDLREVKGGDHTPKGARVVLIKFTNYNWAWLFI